jgi:hypothetical protein
MADDWRVTIDFDDEADGTQLTEWLAALELEAEERGRLGETVIVSRDGPRVFLYADSEERALAAHDTVQARLREQGVSTLTSVDRWHPGEQAWKDASVPLPRTEEEAEAEHERLQAREAAQSLAKGRAEWEVRVELANHEDTIALAEHLEAEGNAVVRRYTFLLVGALNEDDARALAERLEREAPEGTRIDVEAGGGLVWEVTPANPFVVFGGLGA